MPLPKIEKPEQVSLGEGTAAKRLVKVVKIHKEDPSVAGRLVELAAQAKAHTDT